MAVSGYMGKPGSQECKRRRLVSMEELLESGTNLVRWKDDESIGLYDCKGYLSALAVPTPRDNPTYRMAVKEASAALIHVATSCKYFPDQHNHCRGDSMGTGRMAAGNISPRLEHQGEASRFLACHPVFLSIVGHINAALKASAPKLHDHIKTLVDNPFDNGVYPACTFNLGPQVVTYLHKNNMSLPYGWCAVTALGNYAPELRGHIYSHQPSN
ncbi:hypothetical protein OF83DRAFT_1084988 [Amylostereum chailletii]|nr:hypothetical protein OF83DRAFT_1084988 [Amylostereum chailletii]